MKRYKQIKPIIEQEETFKPPQEVANQAKKALDYRNKHGRNEVDAGTSVGWTRANQLANRENLSLDTIKRMYSFFSRHKGNEKVDSKYKDTPWKDKGYVAWLLWGGDAGFNWVKGILKNIGK
jgi:hypothetical protein